MEEYLQSILLELNTLKNEIIKLKAENSQLKNIIVASSPLFTEEERIQAATYVQQARAKQEGTEKLASSFK